MAQRPPTTNRPTRILTTAGWVRASFPLVAGEALLEHIERETGRFLSVVDAEMPYTADRVAGLALQRSTITLIIQDADAGVDRPSPAKGDALRARFMLEEGKLVGTVRVPGGASLASFLGRHEGFFAVYDASMQRNIGADQVHLPVVLVNACRLIAVVEAT